MLQVQAEAEAVVEANGLVAAPGQGGVVDEVQDIMVVVLHRLDH